MEKKQFGQFFTTNSDYILQGLEKFIKNKDVIDPFAGNGDLIKWAKKNKCKKIIGFDCDKKLVNNKCVFYNDSIQTPKKYKFVITNPPYLHKNKADKKTKETFFSGRHSMFEDLYQVSIFSLFNSEEGILIVPLNFLSAENSKKIRNLNLCN
ncbi:MAG: DNA adenine methylase [Patescibacteria group bacterium]